jgi:hypothetical protein
MGFILPFWLLLGDVRLPVLWGVAETNIGIVVASGPAILAFFRHYLPGTFEPTKDSGSRHIQSSLPTSNISAMSHSNSLQPI